MAKLDKQNWKKNSCGGDFIKSSITVFKTTSTTRLIINQEIFSVRQANTNSTAQSPSQWVICFAFKAYFTRYKTMITKSCISFSFLREKYIWNIWTRIKWEAKLKKSIWNILTLPKWEAKLTHWSGTKWTDSMFYITTDWKSITNREKWKSEKRDKYSFTSQIRRLIQNIWNLIFSDFDSTFLILGGVC